MIFVVFMMYSVMIFVVFMMYSVMIFVVFMMYSVMIFVVFMMEIFQHCSHIEACIMGMFYRKR